MLTENQNRKAAYNNGIKPTGNSLKCFSFQRLRPVGSCQALGINIKN